jgi:hypothetical protein
LPLTSASSSMGNMSVLIAGGSGQLADRAVREAPFVVVNDIIRTSGHPFVWPDSAKDSFGGLHPS